MESSKRIIVVLIAVIIIGIAAGYYVLNNEANKVNGVWTFTASPVSDSSKDYYYSGTLNMVVTDGKPVQYTKDISKTEIIKEESGWSGTNMSYIPPSPISFPEPISFLSNEDKNHFNKVKNANPFLDGFYAGNYHKYYLSKTSGKAIETWRFNNNDLSRQYYCDYNGNVFAVLDDSGPVKLTFVLDGWSEIKYTDYVKYTK